VDVVVAMAKPIGPWATAMKALAFWTMSDSTENMCPSCGSNVLLMASNSPARDARVARIASTFLFGGNAALLQDAMLKVVDDGP
jgi:hypothetical protein